MKMEVIRFERVDHFDMAAQLPVVVPRNDQDFATRCEIAQQLGGFAPRHLVVNQIAQNNEPLRFVFADQLGQAIRDRGHSPQRNESARGALAQFITKMEIRYGQPTLALMEEREPAIEENFIGDERLVRA
jgi:hypothetical protein